MLVTVKLHGVTVEEAAAHCRRALDEFAQLPPSYFALHRWLTTSYRRALVGDVRDALETPAPAPVVVTSAQCQLAYVRRLARDGRDLASELPPRVYLARIEDEAGRHGFAPVDAHGGAPLGPRVLSLFFADYLMRPEHYVGAIREIA